MLKNRYMKSNYHLAVYLTEKLNFIYLLKKSKKEVKTFSLHFNLAITITIIQQNFTVLFNYNLLYHIHCNLFSSLQFINLIISKTKYFSNKVINAVNISH